MKNTPLATTLFDQTTVNSQALETYLNTLPIYYETGLENEATPQALELLRHIDTFELAFRSYLGGRTQTMQQIFSELQALQGLDQITSVHLVECILVVVEKKLLHFESYELMPLYQQAKKLIEEQLHRSPKG